MYLSVLVLVSGPKLMWPLYPTADSKKPAHVGPFTLLNKESVAGPGADVDAGVRVLQGHGHVVETHATAFVDPPVARAVAVGEQRGERRDNVRGVLWRARRKYRVASESKKNESNWTSGCVSMKE